MQRQLARLDTARKQFIASASHELRTPIFSLGGFLELLEDEDLDEETRAQFLAQLRGQVERLRKLATELLDLSRLESGAVVAAARADGHRPARARGRGRVHARRRAARAEVELAHRRRADRARLRPRARRPGRADPARQRARPHADGHRIVVSAARENGHVRLDVSDCGPGIKRQTMPHIFEPFFTSADGARGAGLGLAIARELAERMHGELTVRCAPGSTSFTLRIPV